MNKISSFISPSDPPHPEHKSGIVMRFSLFWRRAEGGDEVKETYEKETDDPEKWSREIIDWFNSTLRLHEHRREFIRCEIEGEVPPAEHKWAKLTLMTQKNQYGAAYDGMKCERCGITGKRFGLSPSVKTDSKFSRKVFKRCDTTLDWLKSNNLP